MYQSQHKLKLIKNTIKVWNKESFGNIFKDNKKLEDRLKEIQKKGMQEGYDEELCKEEEILIAQVDQRDKQEEIHWKHKSHNRWLKEGGINTKFFHNSTIQNRQRNKIMMLKMEYGLRVETHEDIEKKLI